MKLFARIWVILLALTAVEIYLCYIQLATVPMLILLLGFSAVKAALIIAYFMHLKFERLSLFLTLFPMLIACILMMLAFLGETEAAARVRDAVAKSEDVVGTTSAIGDAVAERV